MSCSAPLQRANRCALSGAGPAFTGQDWPGPAAVLSRLALRALLPSTPTLRTGCSLGLAACSSGATCCTKKSCSTQSRAGWHGKGLSSCRTARSGRGWTAGLGHAAACVQNWLLCCCPTNRRCSHPRAPSFPCRPPPPSPQPHACRLTSVLVVVAPAAAVLPRTVSAVTR